MERATDENWAQLGFAVVNQSVSDYVVLYIANHSENKTKLQERKIKNALKREREFFLKEHYLKFAPSLTMSGEEFIKRMEHQARKQMEKKPKLKEIYLRKVFYEQIASVIDE